MTDLFAITTLTGEVVQTTDSAVLFATDDGTEFWVPRSVCLDGHWLNRGDVDIIVATWWLEKEGLR